MVNGSSRQNSAASPPSQVRRSSRNVRNSVPRSSNQRRSTSSRSSSIRIPDEALDGFDWGLPTHPADDYSSLSNDLGLGTGFQDGWDYENNEVFNSGYLHYPNNQTDDHIPANFFQNSNVAVPSTPHTLQFPEAQAHQQFDPLFSYQTQQVPSTPQYGTPVLPLSVGGRTFMIPMTENQINMARAAVNAPTNPSGATPLMMIGDGRRISAPRTPSLPGQGSNHRGQIAYGESSAGHGDFLDPSQLESGFDHGYPEITGYSDPHGNHAAQPYFPARQQLLPNNYYPPNDQLQGNFSSGERSNKRPVTRQAEYDLPGLQSVDTRTSSRSTYPSQSSSSGRSRENSLQRSKKIRRDKSRAPLDKRVSVFASDGYGQYQKPKIADFNPEVRINKTTKGLTTRTGKINEYDPRRHYTYTMHPLGTPEQPEGADWRGRYYVHKYNDASTRDQNSGEKTIAIYELEDRAMPADKTRDFILSYPTKRNKLTLRIQVAPGDSGRRYKKDADKCRFAECPARNGGQNRTIKHGFYRVAFDERDDDEYDPFAACCGFAHLYCMERFLDFEYICRKASVVVDTRVQMRREPKGRFAAALEGKQAEAAELADAFINAANHKPDGIRRERGDALGVRQLELFAEYPVHGYRSDETWDATYQYENTLGYHMMRITEGHRAYAQLAQFAKGGLGPTKITVHRGDLGLFAEAYVQDKEYKSQHGKGKKKGARSPHPIGNSDSSFGAEVQRRIERAEAVMAERTRALPLNRQGKKQHENAHKISQRLETTGENDENDAYPEGQEPWLTQDEESDLEFDDRPPRKGARSSKRITGKRPVDYRDEPEDVRSHGRQPKESQKRKRSYSPKMQQNSNQHIEYDRLDQSDWQNNEYYGGQEAQQSVPNRQSHVQYPDYQEGDLFQLGAQEPLWDLQDYDQAALSDLQLNWEVASSPRSAGSKRSRTSQQFNDLFDEGSPESSRSSKRLRSDTGNQNYGLYRRPSSTVSGIMRRPSSRAPSVAKRHASFNLEPVSRQRRFNSNAPPQHVRARMVKELGTDLAKSSQGSKGIYSPGRTLRSGRSLSLATE